MTSSAPRRIASFIGAMILTLTTGTFGWASTTGVCPNTSAVTDSHTGSAAHSQLSATDPSPIVERSGSDWTTCLGSGGVWVYVVYQDGPVLANTCVSDFSTGRQALLSAGLELEDRSDSPGFICTMNGHPDHCVKGREFNGQYWAYWHSTNGRDWTYSKRGADSYRPQPGSIEGWCYNKPGEYRCDMPDMSTSEIASGTGTAVASGRAGNAGSPEANVTSAGNGNDTSESPAAAINHHGQNAADDTKHGNTPWGVVIVLGILVIVGVGYGRWSAHRGRR